jgi:sulfite exporter TauE/SafE
LELTFYTALMIGLLGSTHCIGMCGGIVSALNLGLAQSGRPTHPSRFAHHFTYNAGRILSYTFAGALAGLLGAQATRFESGTALPMGSVIAGLFMIALGLYLGGWWQTISGIEKAGLHVWRYIEPWGRRFLPARTRWQVFGIGLVWGWLPCALVYSALALAVVSASPRQGALLMFGFGVGTLPMLLAMGHFAGHLRKLVRHPVVRQITGAIIMLFGVYTCVTAFSDDGHRHSGADHGFDARNLDQARYRV